MDPQAVEAGEPESDGEADPEEFVYAQIVAAVSRGRYNQLMQEAMDKRDEALPDQNLNYLLLFADKSFSMLGSPWEGLKTSCKQMVDSIFADNPQENIFREVHTIFYEDDIYPSVHRSKATFLKTVEKEEVRGNTDFVKCFDYIQK